MNFRRFLLRLAVACITFVIGISAALLFGATPGGWFAPRHAPRVVVLRAYGGGDDFAPRFEHPPCGSYRMRHVFGWEERRAGEFDFDVPPPPLPPRNAER